MRLSYQVQKNATYRLLNKFPVLRECYDPVRLFERSIAHAVLDSVKYSLDMVVEVLASLQDEIEPSICLVCAHFRVTVNVAAIISSIGGSKSALLLYNV